MGTGDLPSLERILLLESRSQAPLAFLSPKAPQAPPEVFWREVSQVSGPQP